MKQVTNTKQSNTVNIVLLYIPLARYTTKMILDKSISKCACKFVIQGSIEECDFDCHVPWTLRVCSGTLI